MTYSLDPALYDHLRELADLAREIGAEQITLIRQAHNARLQFELPPLPDQKLPPGVSILISTDLPLGQAAPTMLVIIFPTADGGTQPVEVL